MKSLKANTSFPRCVPTIKPTKIKELTTEYLPHALPPATQKTLLDIERKIRNRLSWEKKNVFEIGELLVLAKDTLPHGQFKPWVQKTFGSHLAYTTAALYKSIYETFQETPEMLELFPLRFLELLKRRTFPDDLVQFIKDNPAEFKKEDAEYITKAYGEHRAGKIPQEAFVEEVKEVLARDTAQRKAIYEKRFKALATGVPVKPTSTTTHYSSLGDPPIDLGKGDSEKNHGKRKVFAALYYKPDDGFLFNDYSEFLQDIGCERFIELVSAKLHLDAETQGWSEEAQEAFKADQEAKNTTVVPLAPAKAERRG